MNIQAGKYYQNSKGLIRYVKGIEKRKHRFGTWEEVIYVPILPGGVEGTEKTCSLSTMKGWAKREYDPESADWRSPKREEASALLEKLIDTSSSEQTRRFVDLCVDAAKEELRKELGLI